MGKTGIWNQSSPSTKRELPGRLILGIMWLAGLGLLSGLLLAMRYEGVWTGQRSEVDLERGKRLYEISCMRCHGATGDATDYYGIVPLAGFARRPPLGFVAQFRRPGFLVRGKRFEGAEARDLTVYLSALRGVKGFSDPGWLYSPYLLRRKHDLLSACRIIDVRPEASYLEDHIPNAFPWGVQLPEKSDLGSSGKVAERLSELGILPTTQIVIYDEHEGEEAALAWLSILGTGHPYVAILDGGWTSWLDAGYKVRKDTLIIQPTEFKNSPVRSEIQLPQESRKTLLLGSDTVDGSAVTIDCGQMRGRGGLLPAETILNYLNRCGLERQGIYHVEDQSDQIAFLILVLHLLGPSTVEFDPESDALRFTDGIIIEPEDIVSIETNEANPLGSPPVIELAEKKMKRRKQKER